MDEEIIINKSVITEKVKEFALKADEQLNLIDKMSVEITRFIMEKSFIGSMEPELQKITAQIKSNELYKHTISEKVILSHELSILNGHISEGILGIEIYFIKLSYSYPNHRERIMNVWQELKTILK